MSRPPLMLPAPKSSEDRDIPLNCPYCKASKYLLSESFQCGADYGLRIGRAEARRGCTKYPDSVLIEALGGLAKTVKAVRKALPPGHEVDINPVFPASSPNVNPTSAWIMFPADELLEDIANSLEKK